MDFEDGFGTAALRGTVLDAWTASPARFREDANAEEELVLGGYRDRLIVELAQNAADAAVRGGVPGRVRLRLHNGVLSAANTGAPLTAEGVEALSTLRASAKRDEEAVGRFGVGFASVLSVTDEPRVHSTTGAVRWSLEETRALVGEVPALAAEAAGRDGNVPVLRLPFTAEGTAPEGYDTEAVLPLRDDTAVQLVRRLLAEVDDALLLTLPGITEVLIETEDGVRVLSRAQEDDVVVITDDGTERRWRTGQASGALTPDLLADRPVEERRRPVWSVLWAVPVDGAGVKPVLHAPTPSDEPVGLPALLVASFPMDHTRRHAAPGPLRDFLVGKAADAYATLLRDWPGDAVRLVPGPVAEGELDAELRRAVTARLVETPFLRAAEPDLKLRPRDAVVVEKARPELIAALAPVLPGLLPAGLDRSPALRLLDVRRLPLAEVVDLLASLDREPAWWKGLYTAFDPADAEALGALPVPLTDGRMVRGPRGLLLPGPDTPKDLDPLGLRMVHPEAVHPLLDRLGAVQATPRTILADPAVRNAVEDDELEVAEAVLELVAAARLKPGEEAWLSALLLPDEDGELTPAGELLLPGGEMAALVDPDALALADQGLVDKWGGEVLEAVGVLGRFVVVRDEDVLLDADEVSHDLEGEDAWIDDVLESLGDQEFPPVLSSMTAVRDLDLIADDAWEGALRLLSRPPLRAAVVDPAHIMLPDGTRTDAVPYTAWWLRDHPVLDGRTPAGLLVATDGSLLHGLYEEVDSPLDRVFLTALGVRTTVETLLAEPGGPDELLDRLGDRGNAVGRDQLRSLYTALADTDPDHVDAPTTVRAVRLGSLSVVPSSSAYIGDAPDLAALLADDPDSAVLPVRPDKAARLSDVLDIPLLSEALTGEVLSEGEEHPVPDAVLAALAGAPATYFEHEELLVAGFDGEGVEADWRYVGGVVHATTFEGLARGLAWAADAWHRRFEVAQLLSDPSLAGLLDAERDFDA